MGGRGGSSGGGGGGGGVADSEALLSSTPDNLRNATDVLSSTRSEGSDNDAIRLLSLTEKQGLIDSKIKENYKKLDDLQTKITNEKRNNNNSKVITTLSAKEKAINNVQDRLVSKSKHMDNIKQKVNDYSKKDPSGYKNLNSVQDTKSIKNGKYHIINRDAGLYQKNEMVNPKVSGKVFGAIGYTSDGKGTVKLTHLPSGGSLGSYKKNAVTKEKLTELTNVSKKYNHDSSKGDMVKSMYSVVKGMN